jgi:hypothetical protein
MRMRKRADSLNLGQQHNMLSWIPRGGELFLSAPSRNIMFVIINTCADDFSHAM